jgi:uncharacterized protein YoxC
MLREKFNQLAKEFEETLQQLATNVTMGVVFERLPPMDLWKHAEKEITRLKRLAESCEELMIVLKPEKAATTEQKFTVFFQGLTNFREILFQNSSEPLANSRLALEQLRGAIVDGSEFLLLIKEVRDNPSTVISEILHLREILESSSSMVTIEAPESVQPMLEELSQDIENLRLALTVLERAVLDVKESVRVLQENSIRFTSSNTTNHTKKKATEGNKQQQTEKGQLPLSQFKN